MPIEPLNSTPTPGDGVLTIPSPGEGPEAMAVDVPESVAQANMTLIATNVTLATNRVNGGFDAVSVALAGTVQQNYSEIGTLESRANSGVLATPIAAPTAGGA